MNRNLLLCFLLLLCSTGFAQVLQEGFEGATFPPIGWTSFDNGNGTAQSWIQSTPGNGSTNAAFIRYENVTSGSAEDWLVSPALSLGAADTVLAFFQRQEFATDYGSVYTVRVSTDTSQTNTAAFTTIDTQPETAFGTTYSAKTVSLAAYAGMTVYIAFVMTNDDGDNWYVDDVHVGGPPCLITSGAATNITATSADLGWAPSAMEYEYELVNGGAAPTGAGVNTLLNPVPVSGLNPGTNYDYYVRSFCDGDMRMMITGAFDGPLPGGLPKVMSFYTLEAIPDLSVYGASSANNGTGTTAPNPEFVFPAVSVAAGTHLYITSDSAAFATYFGFNADFVNSTANINGDDAIELLKDSVVVDVFGDVNNDGTGTAWEYLDGWAYRKPGMLPTPTFTVTDWDYSGINAIDGCSSNGTCSSMFPAGTFMGSLNTSPWAGPFSFTTLCLPVTGDSISDPIMVSGVQYNDTSSTENCYSDQIGNLSNDVFYMLITDPCATSIDVSLCGSSYDTYLRILDAQGGSIATNDDACGTASEILGQAVSGGDTVLIVVEGYSTNNGSYVLSITQNLTTPSATISYPSASYCPSAGLTMATISGDTGGTFAATPAGMTINATTGEIDPQTSTAGTYAVVYSVGQAGCIGTDTSMIIIQPLDSINIQYPDTSFCKNEANPIPVNTGSPVSFVAALGASVNPSTGEIDLNSAFPGTYVIQMTSSGACPTMDSVTITINAAQSSFFSYPSATYCQTAGLTSPDSVSNPGGTFSSNPPSVVWNNLPTGEIDLQSTPVGVYNVSYTTSGACSDTTTVTVEVLATDVAAVQYAANAYCDTDTDPIPTVSGAAGTFSSATGLVINPTTGEIDLSASSADSNHVVQFITSGPCPDTLDINLIVSICTSIESGLATDGFGLFPVPNDGHFNILNKGVAEEISIEIHGLDGKVVFRSENYLNEAEKLELSLDDVTAGIYFVRIQSATRLQTIKMTVQK